MGKLSVVTSAFNDAGCLVEFHRRVVAVLERLALDFEIVMVDDGSRDDTWRVMSDLAGSDARVRAIQFSRNFGQHYGITAGLDVCDGDWVVVMDCDLQDRPEEIPRLHAKAIEGYDVVLARRGRRRDPLLRRFVSWGFARMFSYFTDMERDEQVGTFRIVSRRVVDNFRTMREQLRFFGGMLDWMGFPTTSIPVQHDARASGRSSYDLKRRWRLAQDAIVAYSDKPLKLTVRLGFVIASAAFLYGLYVVCRALFYGTPVVGWSSLIASMYFLGGITIATLGVVGIYLGRAFAEVKRRPLYIIKERRNP